MDEERLISVAMSADAAQVGLEFIHFWGRRDLDSSEIPSEIQSFIGKINCLFVDGECTKLGHTKYMIDLLSEPVPIPKRATGQPTRTIGGIDLDPIIQRCLGRIRC